MIKIRHQKTLNSLTIMLIEKEDAMQLDLKTVVEKFIERNLETFKSIHILSCKFQKAFSAVLQYLEGRTKIKAWSK